MALKRKGQINKERLIEIGKRQMLEASYNSVGIQSIVEEARLPKASFYYYFKSKEEYGRELFQSYMENYFETHRQFLEPERNPGKNAMQRIDMLYQSFYQKHRKNDWKIPCLFMKIAAEVNSESELIRRTVKEGIDRILALHEQVIKAGLKDGSLIIPRAFSVEIFAELLFNQWKGAVILSDVQRSGAALDRFFLFLHTVGNISALGKTQKLKQQPN